MPWDLSYCPGSYHMLKPPCSSRRLDHVQTTLLHVYHCMPRVCHTRRESLPSNQRLAQHKREMTTKQIYYSYMSHEKRRCHVPLGPLYIAQASCDQQNAGTWSQARRQRSFERNGSPVVGDGSWDPMWSWSHGWKTHQSVDARLAADRVSAASPLSDLGDGHRAPSRVRQ